VRGKKERKRNCSIKQPTSTTTRTIREKYCDYFIFNIVDFVCVNYISVDYDVNCGLPRSGARRRALA
jgi:hypothetical protein